MNIQNISLSNIHPYARNPRKNDEAVKNVAASIREFGFLVPLVIDRNHEIVAGHTRYKAAKSLGMKEVPCVIADELTEDQIKAFRLADNKVSEAAQWDMDLLPLELADIMIPMADFGFETTPPSMCLPISPANSRAASALPRKKRSSPATVRASRWAFWPPPAVHRPA